MPHIVFTIVSARLGTVGWLHTSLPAEKVLKILAPGLHVTTNVCSCNYGMDSPEITLNESH